MELLPPAEGYRLWAPTYGRETPLTVLEDRAARTLTGPLEGRALVDVGCGTGRRLAAALGEGAGPAVGVDLVREMLLQGRAEVDRPLRTVVADVRRLPFAASRFDVVWCRLVLGHVPDAGAVYSELARVARSGARIVVTDFHPAMAGEGHRRTFRDASGRLRALEHHVHSPEEQLRHARASGLERERRLDVEVGPEIRSFYEDRGEGERYEEQVGMEAVLALSFVRV